ncbi:small integral membrane protein 15 isoform X1 [Sceloporus undulatus]|nr:small integral membrane protein 15 isoform X1 [Sceloporus undulatus]
MWPFLCCEINGDINYFLVAGHTARMSSAESTQCLCRCLLQHIQKKAPCCSTHSPNNLERAVWGGGTLLLIRFSLLPLYENTAWSCCTSLNWSFLAPWVAEKMLDNIKGWAEYIVEWAAKDPYGFLTTVILALTPLFLASAVLSWKLAKMIEAREKEQKKKQKRQENIAKAKRTKKD